MLVGREVERPILDERPADARADLEALDRLLRDAAVGQRFDESPGLVPGVRRALNEGLPGRVVGSLPSDDVEQAAGGPTKLGGVLVGQQHELPDHLLREEAVGRSAARRVVIVQAVHQKRVRARRLSVDREHRAALADERARRRSLHGRVEQRQIEHHAAGHRQVGRPLARDGQLAGGLLAVHERRSGVHRDALGEPLAHGEIQGCRLLQVQRDGARVAQATSVAQAGHHRPVARRQPVEAVAAAAVADGGAQQAGRLEPGLHHGFRDRLALLGQDAPGQ